MDIVFHKNYLLLIVSVASSLLHYSLAQDACSSNIQNTIVSKGGSASFPELNIYPNQIVQWQVAPSNVPFLSLNPITDETGKVQDPYPGIYSVNTTQLTILKATTTPQGSTDPTAGLYVANYQNPNTGDQCMAAAGLTVVEISPTCSNDAPDLSCSITFANYIQQQIVPIMTWKDSSGNVVLTDKPIPDSLDENNLGLQQSTSTFRPPSGSSGSYTCEVTFSPPDPNQPSVIASNAPDYTQSCSVIITTPTAATTTTKLQTSTATTTAAATSTTTKQNPTTTPLVTTTTKLLTSTATTTTAAATTTTTTPNPTTTPLVTTTTKPLTSTATTTAAATTTNPTTTPLAATTTNLLTSIVTTTAAATTPIPASVAAQTSAMSSALSAAISQLSDNPTTAAIATTNAAATATIEATLATNTAAPITETVPEQSTNPPISNIAVTPANTPIAATQLQTETVATPASTTTSSTISPPASPVSPSGSTVYMSSFSESTTTSAPQPSAVPSEPDTDAQAQAQTLKIVLGLILGSLLTTGLVSACWCYCCFFPLGVGVRGAKQTQRILYVRRIFYFWRREPPVEEIYTRSYYPVCRRQEVVCDTPCRYPALRKTFHWREPNENGVFWRWDPTACDAYSGRDF